MTRPSKLELSEVDEALVEADSPWTRVGEQLVLERRFETFSDAILFVGEVAALAEEADHHPDIEIHYTLVKLTVSTHDAGGLTVLDLDLAEAIAAIDNS